MVVSKAEYFVAAHATLSPAARPLLSPKRVDGQLVLTHSDPRRLLLNSTIGVDGAKAVT
jgi:hypothetical protein